MKGEITMKRREFLKTLGSSYTRFIHTRIIPALSLWQWWAVAIITIVGSQLTMSWLNGQYAETLFPVPFYIGQTALLAGWSNWQSGIRVSTSRMPKKVSGRIQMFARLENGPQVEFSPRWR
jgi:hypothetical protein